MMKKLVIISLCFCMALTASGCSTVKRLTGVRDDTVLPGERENVLPADQQTWSDPNVKKNQAETQANPQTSAQTQSQSQASSQGQPQGRAQGQQQSAVQSQNTGQSQQPCKLNDLDCEPAGAYEPGKPTK